MKRAMRKSLHTAECLLASSMWQLKNKLYTHELFHLLSFWLENNYFCFK